MATNGASDTESPKRPRPLSPHLQVYRLPFTALLSISHRITGAALVVGTLVLTWWLMAAATGPEAFAVAREFIASPIGLVLMFGWTVALFYHLCNGIRHLCWDIGLGLELQAAHTSGWVSLGASAVLSVAVWLIAFMAG